MQTKCRNSNTVNESSTKKKKLKDAIRDDKVEKVRNLIKEGVDIAVDDNVALRNAAENGYEGIVKLLIEAGANVKTNGNYAIRIAAANGYEGIVKLLIEAGADPTSLMTKAVKNGKLEIVKLLIETGAIENMKEYILMNLIH